MPLNVNVGGSWKHVRLSTKVSGQWREVPQVYVKVSGVWKPLYSFTWETGAWGECSASCGGGTQTRTVRAKRSDGQYFNDAVGTRFAGEKPATSEACNTQECTECRYDENNVWTVTAASMNAAGECLAWTIGTVLWDGETVYADDGWDSATVDGYLYTRSTLQSETGDNRCPSKHGMKHEKISKYTVCRTPA